ncbi:DUF805 domain-containing protein [Rahnella ecdela]|jgi:uncharacterized membrane protein YhaH (DUF805 family)|uniref:DUF805 domain-containing protein n=1 Tax=Rahnella ecdela TaxID=2816250 RepID=A0ABS6LL46_9GAMM|nr:DUF805 domain-containing protein [Rahnella ecdela]MBU9847266.1 DUF805 domain-containing protein [Rahnella ecdela]
MSVWQCFVQGWKGYVKFEGRATRKEFWVFTLVNILLMILLTGTVATVLALAGNPYGVMYAGMAYTLYALALALPILAVGIRRMHDINRSGWWFGGVYLAGIVSRLLNMILQQYASPETYANGTIVLGILLGWVPLLVMIYLCCQKSRPPEEVQSRIVE